MYIAQKVSFGEKYIIFSFGEKYINFSFGEKYITILKQLPELQLNQENTKIKLFILTIILTLNLFIYKFFSSKIRNCYFSRYLLVKFPLNVSRKVWHAVQFLSK